MAAAQGIDAANSRDVVRHVREARRRRCSSCARQGAISARYSRRRSTSTTRAWVGGDIADEHLLAGMREVVYRRAVPLGTRSLRIARSTLDDRAGVIGAAVMVIEHVFAPDVVDRMVAAG